MTNTNRDLTQSDGYLREADRRVRALTFALGSVRADPLLAAWPPFLAASAQVLAQLGPAGTPAAAVLQGQLSSWAWTPPSAVEAEPALVAATTLLQQARRQLEQHHRCAVPGQDARTGHVLGTVCVGAHVVAAATREHLDTLPAGPARETGQDTYAPLITQLAQAEDYALTALQHAGQHPWPAEPPADQDRPCSGGTP